MVVRVCHGKRRARLHTRCFVEISEQINTLWVLLAVALVFLMQAGFLCLEAGLTRSKNSINVAVKNMADFGLSVLIFWAVGFGIMFGTTQDGHFGTSLFAFDVGSGDTWTATFFLFQAVFCGTAVTIVSGAVAERVRFGAYLLIVAVISLLIYPFFGHWAWGGALLGDQGGWLMNMGFVDFAGSTVVHSVGGWAALAACLVLGARLDRFDDNGKPRQTVGSNLPIAMLGALLLWIGWIGFNGGSTLALNGAVPGIIANTMLAAAAGMAITTFAGWIIQRYPHPTMPINGCLAGLVAITAGCHAVTALEALLIGAVGGLLAFAVAELLLKLKIDDVISAVPVHLAAGAWGTLAVALFADPAILGTGLTMLEQLKVQAIGVAACGGLTFTVTFVCIGIAHKLFGLRVSEEAERQGLNFAEHRTTTELFDLAGTIERQTQTSDLTLRAPVEPFTEVGQLAQRYNELMDFLEATKLDVDELNHMTANVPGMVYQYTRDQNGQESFPYVSKGCRDIFGLEPEVFQKDPAYIMNMIHEDDRESLLEVTQQSSATQTTCQWEGRVVSTDGQTRWVRVVSRPMAMDKGTVRWDGMMLDVTEAKIAEQQIADALTKAEDASRAKSMFLANMSHEIRTPLHGILSFADFGKKKVGKVDEAKLKSYFEKIDTSGNRLLKLVNDLLDLSKLEAGRMRFEFEDALLAMVVGGVVDEMGSLLANRGSRVQLHRPDGKVRAEVDALKLMQVVRNLLHNAVKFSPADKPIDVTIQDMGDTVRVEVRDQGCGIPEAELGAVFEKFIQSSTTNSGAGGTGLGLSICTEIIEGHHGRIWAENHPEGGARMFFEVPKKQPESNLPSPPKTSEPQPEMAA